VIGDVEMVGKILAGRLQDLTAVLERHDAFVVRPEEGGRSAAETPQGSGDLAAVARDMVLRMLSVAASPDGSALLRELADRDHTSAELATRFGRPRLTVWEQVNDLVQVGLAAREYGEDRVGLTQAGLTVAELIEHLVLATTGELTP